VVSASAGAVKAFPSDKDPLYDACWETVKQAHAPALVRRDTVMEILWPSTGDLVFFGEDLSKYPASAFVMESIGISPPGSGLHLTVDHSSSITSGSFRPRPGQKIVSVPTTLVRLRVTYQDPLTSPASYAPGAYKWANTVKRPRRALKVVTTQWVVFSGLKKHGFPGDVTVVNLPVVPPVEQAGEAREAVPFVTQTSRAVPDSLLWWEPQDMPGLLIAAAARAASFPDLRDRVALLNRVLIIDPNQPDALTVLTKDLYALLLREAAARHKVSVKDPALAFVVNELYWNIHAQGARTDLSIGMEMGGYSQPTAADYLYRMIPAMEALAKVRPEALDNRFRLGVAYRWNNDQQAAIETHEALVKAIPVERKQARAEAVLQLAWSRINKVAWNRTMDDPEIQQAYREAEEALALADLPLDKFNAEYTMAYSMLFMPKRENAGILQHLSEAKRWYGEVPGNTKEIWQYFLSNESFRAVLDADPSFKPLLAGA
jgi:tetratricopeptide (TPR) repeat protein